MSSEKDANSKVGDPDKKYKIALAVSTGCLLGALIVAFILLFVFRTHADQARAETLMSQTVTVGAHLKDEDKHFVINQHIVLEHPDARASLGIKNVNKNQDNILVEIYDTQSEQLIYRSYRIPNQFEIQEDYLGVQLEKGTYPCVAYFEVLDPGDQVTEIIGTDVVVEVQN